VVALDGTGRRLGVKSVPATDAGHASALRWARLTFAGEDLTLGIEDVRHVSGRFERFLLDSGVRCVRVPTTLMFRAHLSARTPGKSDPIDAQAVAQAVLREPDLPVASHDDVSREFKLFVDHREDLVSQRTAVINNWVLWRIHEVDPARDPRTLLTATAREAPRGWLTGQPGLVAELAVIELDDITRLTEAIDALERRITLRVRAVAPSLLVIPGCGALTAAKLTGESALVTRFRSESAFAAWAGLAPVPRWSGSTEGRMRRSRSGNRAANAAIHRIAVTQLRLDGPGRAYYDKRVAAGDSSRTAMRCLKRRLARVVFGHLHTDLRIRAAAAGEALARTEPNPLIGDALDAMSDKACDGPLGEESPR
jgi:transposase